jgi:hypothetical protein
MVQHHLQLKPTVLCVHVFLHCDDYPQILPLTKDTSKMTIGSPLASVGIEESMLCKESREDKVMKLWKYACMK